MIDFAGKGMAKVTQNDGKPYKTLQNEIFSAEKGDLKILIKIFIKVFMEVLSAGRQI